MSYQMSRESVIKMAKKVFERQVDESVIELTEDEKAELRSRLESVSNVMRNQMQSVEQEDFSGKSPNAGAQKTSLFRSVWNFLRSLILNVPFKKDANISFGRLKEIKARLANFGIRFYDFKKEAVSSDLALFLVDIYRGARQVFHVFVNPDQDPKLNFYRNLFFDQLFSEPVRMAKERIMKEQIEKVFYDQNVSNKRDYLKRKQKEFADALKETDYKRLQGAILPIDHLINIYHLFDFEGFFLVFGRFQNGTLDIDYNLVEPQKVQAYLEKLGALLKFVTEDQLPSDMIKVLQHVNTVYKQHNSVSQDPIQVDVVNKSLLMARKLMKFEIIDALLQYISMNEMAISGFVKSQKVLLNKYLDAVVGESTKDFNHMEDEKAKEFLIKNILDFFEIDSEKKLLYGGIMRPEHQQYLRTQDINTMNTMKSLAILLTFFNKYYDSYLRQVINTVVVKGSFVKKMQGEEFSTFYYQLDDGIEKLNTYVRDEMTTKEDANHIVHTLIESRKELSNVERKTVRAKIDKFDSDVMALLEKIMENLYKIDLSLKAIYVDFRKKYPEVLSNVNQLKGIGNTTFATSVEKALEIMDTFFGIMRNYVIIKNEVNDMFKKMESQGQLA